MASILPNVQCNLYTSFIFALLFNLSSTKSQFFDNTISIKGENLPFREVLISCTDKNNFIWLLATNELCRLSDGKTECFEIPVKETNDIFIIADRYLILHNKFGLQSVYFDLIEYKFEKFNFSENARIFKNLYDGRELFFIEKNNIYSYDFIQKKI